MSKTAIAFKANIDKCEQDDPLAEKFLRSLMSNLWDTMPKDVLIKMCRYLYMLENQAENN